MRRIIVGMTGATGAVLGVELLRRLQQYVLWALGTRIHPNLRQHHWPVPILPRYQCYADEERHSGRGPIVLNDGLLASLENGQARPATFDNLYPPEIRERVLATEPRPAVPFP
jgi:hypothetical protein